jgi:hypothetical protein
MLISDFGNKLVCVGHALETLPGSDKELGKEDAAFLTHALSVLLPSDAQPYCVSAVVASPVMFARRAPARRQEENILTLLAVA